MYGSSFQMEGEAALGDAHLGAQVGIRRRSTSVSDDYSVQKTNDDATECKYAAVKVSLDLKLFS